MTAGTDQLAAATTFDELEDIKDLLEVESTTAKAAYVVNMTKSNEHSTKANEFRSLANDCKLSMHDVGALINTKVLEIYNGQ